MKKTLLFGAHALLIVAMLFPAFPAQSAGAAGGFSLIAGNIESAAPMAGASDSTSTMAMPADLMQAVLETTTQPFEAEAEGYRAQSGGLEFSLNAGGLQASADGLSWSLSLTGLGRADKVASLPQAGTAQTADGVEVRRGELTEWYRATALGLEQGFTLLRAPQGQGQLIMQFDLATDLTVTADADGRGLAFAAPDGRTLRYNGLRAWDADGAELEASLQVIDGLMVLAVEDAGAVYPITIDPLVYLEQKVIASGRAGDEFGVSVALYGNGGWALVGASSVDVGTNLNQGAVYVFEFTGKSWVLQQRLTASDGAQDDYFGYSVAIHEGTVLIGAYGDDVSTNTDQGSAYVFEYDGTSWAQQAKLTASDGATGDRFGYAVALGGDPSEGNTALVGAYQDDISGRSDQGSAYVFARSGTTWSQQAKLTGSVGAASDLFGGAVAIHDDTAVVGAYFDQVGGNLAQGSVYVFTRSGTTWSEEDYLWGWDGASGDLFGYSVAIQYDTILVGARNADDTYSNQGAVYSFSLSGSWIGLDKLTAVDGQANDGFGSSVDMYLDRAVIGADGATVSGKAGQGAAYLFTQEADYTWTEQKKITAPDGAADDAYGVAVAIHWKGSTDPWGVDTVLVGVWHDDVGPNADQGSVYVYTGSGADWSQQAQLTGTDGRANDYFGQSVAISGNTAVVGAPYGDVVGITAETNEGVAYVFVFNGKSWVLQQKLTEGANVGQNDFFGYSVAIAGDTILVAARDDDIIANTDQGSVYVFTRSGTIWTQQQILTALDGDDYDYFGCQVSLSWDGNTALAGSYSDNVGANGDQGSAYVFTRSGTTWSQQAQLTASDGAAGDKFGFSVVLSSDGNTALVGSYLNDVGTNTDQGSVYVFTRSGTTWSQQQVLTASDGATEDLFGYAVTISGERALIGAPTKFLSFADQGSAYVFTRSGSTWTQQANLSAWDGDTRDYFGGSVAISGNIALVGASSDVLAHNGTTHVFTGNGSTWIEQGTLRASDAVNPGGLQDFFGGSVALSGNTALVGASYDDIGNNPDQGSAYFFDLLNFVPMLEEDFDEAIPSNLPAGWTKNDVSGTQADWKTLASSQHPTDITPHSLPNIAVLNSYSAVNNASNRLWYSSSLDFTKISTASLSFWMYHDTDYSSNADNVRVQVSTDGGSSWTTVGPVFNRYDGTTGWRQETVDLGAYLSYASVHIGFLGTSQYGNDCHIDDILLTGFDSTPPTVVSITRADPDPTNAYSLHYNVTFSEPVSGVGTSDFSVTASGSAAGSVYSVSGSGTTYTVTVNSTGGEGTLRLDIPAGASITDLAGQAPSSLPYTGGQTYTVDKTNPTALSIMRAGGNPTNAASVDFALTFSEAVTGVAANDFLPNASGLTGASVSNVSGSGASYTVTVSTGTGNGTLGLGFHLGTSIYDLAGNYYGGGISGENQTYTIDKNAPTVLSVTRLDPNYTGAASVRFAVTFSEEVFVPGIADFVITKTGTISGETVSGDSCSGAGCTITVSRGTGNGTLRLDIPGPTMITDLAGNSLSSLPFTGGDIYTVGASSFNDVAMDYWAWLWVERLYSAGITGGCGTAPLIYCPENSVTRAQMAIFLERGMRGSGYIPPAGTGLIFGDVPGTYWAVNWIEKLFADGITSGCGGGNYCPENPVTRAQMAIFLLRAKHGASYMPPTAGGTMFTDVPISYWAVNWIEQLATEGITGGCGTGLYCPDNPVTRAQMAVFLVRTFSLP